ncbi:MAG TPA: SpoIIE family protein phosphatase [Nocardioides sp.]|nr:SpoIIE family protein phosphatase [Nocardioides sp.]
MPVGPDGSDIVGMTHEEDTARVAALQALDVLDTAPEERFDRIVRLARQLFGVGTAGINLVDRDRQFTKAGVGGLRPGDMARGDSVCTRTVQDEGLLEIPDAHADPAWSDHPTVVGDLGLRFYAGVPLHAPGGERVGALCLIDDSPRTLTPVEQELLATLGELVERELASSADLESGREVQRRLLPRTSPELPGWEFAGACVQMHAVGGDFYDWLPVGEQVQVMLCDVMGKGLSAALVAAGVRVLARGAAPHHTLTSTMARVAGDIAGDLEETGSFVTAFLARVDPTDGALEYIDAGHGLAFVLERDGGFRRLVSDGMPLGALPDETWESADDRIEPGESLVVVSDGLLDLHGDVATVAKVVATMNDDASPVEDVARSIVESGGTATADDVTVVLVRRRAA